VRNDTCGPHFSYYAALRSFVYEGPEALKLVKELCLASLIGLAIKGVVPDSRFHLTSFSPSFNS
jgi:hypothetical protein